MHVNDLQSSRNLQRSFPFVNATFPKSKQKLIIPSPNLKTNLTSLTIMSQLPQKRETLNSRV